MYLRQHTEICVLHAISPVHAGSGAATGAVDLPIQRERHTGWPMIQSTGVKGAMRDHCVRFWMADQDNLSVFDGRNKAEEAARAIFGAEKGDQEAQAGAVAFSDAKLLAFPVRSNRAPFVWTTCPALLKRLDRDLDLAGTGGLDNLPSVEGDEYVVAIGDRIDGQLILEDICLSRAKDGNAGGVEELFQKLAPEVDRLVLVPDQHFSFLVETATEIQAQIAIDPERGVTKTGSLRYEELLPAETILYTVVFFGNERTAQNPFQVDTIKNGLKAAVSDYVQMGGDMTVGRGIFAVNWV